MGNYFLVLMFLAAIAVSQSSYAGESSSAPPECDSTLYPDNCECDSTVSPPDGSISSPGEDADVDHRAEFRNLIIALSLDAQTRPLSCNESHDGGAQTDVQYSFTLEDEPNYKDAFVLRFKTVDAAIEEWATLVAYEGYNGYVMGRLSRTENGESLEFQHSFRGFYEDILGLTVVRGKIGHLSYQKIGPKGLHYQLNCDAN